MHIISKIGASILLFLALFHCSTRTNVSGLNLIDVKKYKYADQVGLRIVLGSKEDLDYSKSDPDYYNIYVIVEICDPTSLNSINEISSQPIDSSIANIGQVIGKKQIDASYHYEINIPVSYDEAKSNYTKSRGKTYNLNVNPQSICVHMESQSSFTNKHLMTNTVMVPAEKVKMALGN